MNRPTYTTNDSQPGTNKVAPKDFYATWTAATPNPAIGPPTHYYRSSSGYPTGPEYVSSSKRHGEKPSPPGHDHRVRSEMSESHRLLVPSQARHRDSTYPDPSYSRSRRKDVPTEPTPLTSAPRTHVSNDPNAPQPVQYERWIPPTQYSPSQQKERQNKERDKHERERDKEKQRPKEEYYRERRDQDNTREKHRRRVNEGESDWDRERERRERREKERYREWEREKARDQDRERVKEEYADRLRGERNNAKGPERYQDEKEQEKYMEIERQKAVEKERDKEREKERRRQEREKERERLKERKDRERADDARPKTDTERDKEKDRKRERELARREREYRRELESGRESDRDPDRRRRKGVWEQEKTMPREDQPFAARDSPQHEVEHDQVKKTHDAAMRRYQAVNAVEAAPTPLVGRDQEAERVRHSKKDAINLMQKEHEKAQKVGDESEAERVRYSDKENILRREHKAYEKMKRIAAMRSYADRATDSERENPLHRDVPPSVHHKRETVFRGIVEPDTATKPPAVPSMLRAYSKDDKGSPVTQPGYPGTGTRITTSENPRQVTTNDGSAGYSYPMSVPRPVDPNTGTKMATSETPRQSATNDGSAGHSHAMPAPRPVDPRTTTSDVPRQAITKDGNAGYSSVMPTPRLVDSRTTTSEASRQAITNDGNPGYGSTIPAPRPFDPRTTTSEVSRQAIANDGHAGYSFATPAPRPVDASTGVRPTTSETLKQAITNDNNAGYRYSMSVPRPIDPRTTTSETPRQATTNDGSPGHTFALSVPRPVESSTGMRTITSEAPRQAIMNDNNAGCRYSMSVPRPIDPRTTTSETPRQATTNDGSPGHTFAMSVPRPVESSTGTRTITSEAPRQAIMNDGGVGYSSAMSVSRPVDPSAGMRATTSESPRQEITYDGSASYSSAMPVPRPADLNTGTRTTMSETPRQGITNDGNTGHRYSMSVSRPVDLSTGMRTITSETPRQAIMNDGSVGYSYSMSVPRPVDLSPGMRPTMSETPRQVTTNDGNAGYTYTMSVPRPIDPTTSTTPKHSPISAVSISGESPRLDSNGQEARARQGPSIQRTLKRQSRMTSLIPEQTMILPPMQSGSKHSQPQAVSQSQADLAPLPASGHTIRSGKDITRVHVTQLSADTPEHPLPSLQPPLTSKVDNNAPSSGAIHGSAPAQVNYTTSRVPTRDSMAFVQLTHDKRSAEASRQSPKDLQGITSPEAPLLMGKVTKHVHNSAGSHTTNQAAPDHVNPRPSISGPDMGITQAVTHPVVTTERVASKDSAKSGSRGTDNSSLLNNTPLRKPFSALGGPGLQERDEGGKDNVTHVPAPSNHPTNAPAPQLYPIDRSTSVEGQYSNGSNEPQLPSSGRRPATTAHEPKQDAPPSRGHSKVPISENAGTQAPNYAAFRVQMDTPQRSVPTVDKRSQLEPPPMSRVASRSAGDPVVVNSSVVNKPRSGKQGRDEGGQSKRVVTEPYHTSYSVNPEAALRSLTSQHKPDDLSHPAEDPVRPEANQQHSPGISLRRETFAQPSLHKGPNGTNNVETPTARIVHPRAPSLTHGLGQSSPGKTAERSIVIPSDSSSSRPTEEKHDHVIQGSVERHMAQSDAGPLKDPPNPARDRAERIPDNSHSTERAVLAPSTSAAVENDVIQVASGWGIHSTPQNIGARNDSSHPGQHQHRRRSQYPIVDSASVATDPARMEIKEGPPSRKTQSPNKGHVHLSSREEQGSHRPGPDVSRPQADIKLALHHEGLAKVLDQPVRKTGTSPSTQGSKNILPPVEIRTNVNEVDHRHPSNETPKNVPQYNTPSPVVKSLHHSATHNGLDTNQENPQRTSDSRLNESPSRYPHSIYRSSSLYPAPSNLIPSPSINHSKYPTNSSHTIPNHPQASSLPPATVHVTKIRDSPSSHQQNIASSIPSHDVRETTPVIHSQQMPSDNTENSDLLASKYNAAPNRGYLKEPDIILQRSTRPDNSRMPYSKPFAPVPSSQPLEPSSNHAAYQHSSQPDTRNRITESGPVLVPTPSLLFSKGTEATQTSLEPSNGDNRDILSNHTARGAEHNHASSHTAQDFEKHEPRLITPRVQKSLELQEEPHHKSASLDNTRSKHPQLLPEMHKKSESLDAVKGKASHEQSRPPEIWYPPASSREDERDRRRYHATTVAPGPTGDVPAGLPMGRNLSLMIPLDEAAEQAKLTEKRPNITDVKVYRYLREKRNRTISALSTEAQDGTAPSTVMGSPTASILSQPPIHVPPLRDPMKAAHEWLVENMEAAARGRVSGKRRILRPGVVFDVGEDPPLEERKPRSKPSRSKTQTMKGT